MKDSTPVLVGAAVGGAALLLLVHHEYGRAERSTTPTTPAPPSTGQPTPAPPAPSSTTTNTARQAPPSTTNTTSTDVLSGLWLWPVPIVDGHRPVVSDGWASPRDGGKRLHAGVDLMFVRRTPKELIDVYKPGSPNGDRNYFMRDDALALAASAGRVWSAYKTVRGFQVVIDHGSHATLYQHLEHLFLDERHDGPGGPLVEAGHPLGIVGGDPTNPPHLKHLHFELWIGSTPVNPEPYLGAWQLVQLNTRASGATDVALVGAARTTRTA